MAAAKTSLGNDEIASMMDEAAQRTSNLYGEFYGFYPTLGMNENGLTDQFAVGIAVWANRNLGHNWKNLVNMVSIYIPLIEHSLGQLSISILV